MTTLVTLASAGWFYFLLGLLLSLTFYGALRLFRPLLEGLGPEQRADLYAAAVLTPPSMVTILALTAVVRPDGPHNWPRHLQHFWFDHADEHGLCLLFLGVSTALAVTVLTVAVRRVMTVLIATVRLNRQLAQQSQPPSEKLIQAARCVSRPDEAQVPMGETDGTQPISLVFGIRRPQCLFSRPLVTATTGEELAGVVGHELAHVHRGDNLQKLILRLAAALQWVFPWVASLMRQWQLEVELACDDRAVSLTGSPRSLAKALVKVAQSLRSPLLSDWTPAVLSGFCEGGQAAVRIRAERLIHRSASSTGGGSSTPAPPRPWVRGAIRTGIGGGVLLASAVLSHRLLAPSIAWLTEYVARHCH